MLLQLFYDTVLVGNVEAYTAHQGTWFGKFQQSENGLPDQRLCDYIAFCKKWHARLDAGEDPDAAEFDQFNDLIKSRSWHARNPDGSVLEMDGAPGFYDGEITWNHPECEPSREVAANREWSRLSKLA